MKGGKSLLIPDPPCINASVSDGDELVEQASARNENAIVDSHMAADERAIGNDDVIAEL